MVLRFRPLAFTFAAGVAATLIAAPGVSLAQRVTTEVFSVSIPPSPGWRLIRNQGRMIAFARGPVDSKTFLAIAMWRQSRVSTQDDLVKLADRLSSSALKQPARKLSLSGAQCVSKAFGRNTREPGGQFQIFGINTYCLHPRRKGVVVQLGFSHRHPRGAEAASPRQDLEAFLQSLRFR